MKALLVAAIALAAVAVALSTAGASTGMKLSCVIGGQTTVSKPTSDKSHFRFRWFYADGSSYTAHIWAYYASEVSHGSLSILTHGTPTHALAIEHTRSGRLVRVRGACS